MNTNDFNRPLNSDSLNESLQKTFNVQINFDKYTREQLENYRNLIRTKVHQVESTANFNDLLSNEVYQKDKFVLNVLNTRIKEMLGEAKLAEKAVSKAQQKFMGMVHATQKGKKAPSKEVAKVAKSMGKKDVKDFAKTKHKGLPAHVDEAQVNELSPETIKAARDKRLGQLSSQAGATGPKTLSSFTNPQFAKPSVATVNKYWDQEKARQGRNNPQVLDPHEQPGYNKGKASPDELSNWDKKYPQGSGQQAWDARTDRGIERNRQRDLARGNMINVANKKLAGTANVPAQAVEEGTKMKTTKKAKPDFLDMDKDGNKKEPMKKAVADKKKTAPMKKPAADKKKTKVKESIHDLRHRAYQSFIAEGLANYLAEDEEGKAKAITAGADMVNDFTSWMQRVGNYQTKSMIELADNIRANFGVQQAETFKASVGQALEGALNALTAAREEINNAVAVLAGEAPAEEPMGQEPGMGEPAMGGDVRDLDAASPDAMNLPSMDDEFAASDAAAGGMDTTGRMKRESIERGNRLMKILGS